MAIKNSGAKMASAKRLIANVLEKNMAEIRADVLMSILRMPFHKRVEFAFRVIFKIL